ncbi:hypothetical protein SCOR_24830 [Sulfidibacter corallicola]
MEGPRCAPVKQYHAVIRLERTAVQKTRNPHNTSATNHERAFERWLETGRGSFSVSIYTPNPHTPENDSR